MRKERENREEAKATARNCGEETAKGECCPKGSKRLVLRKEVR